MRRQLVWAGAVGALVLLVAWGWRDLASAREKLQSARHIMEDVVEASGDLRTGEGRSEAVRRIRAARSDVHAAKNTVRRSVPLTMSLVVPALRLQRVGAARLIDDADAAAAASESVLTNVESLAERAKARGPGIPFPEMASLRDSLAASARVIASGVRSPRGLWGELADARRTYNRVAESAARRLQDGADATQVAGQFLGGAGDRRYLVAMQNNAEMRDQGMILAYGIVRFTGGQLSFERVGHIDDLHLAGPTSTPIPEGTKKVFGAVEPTWAWQNVNSPADFAWSGRAMADMTLAATGAPIDGVIAVDVVGLGHVLRAVGPVEVAGLSQPLTGDNAVQVLLHDQYQGRPVVETPAQKNERVATQSQATLRMLERITSGSADPLALARELGSAAAGTHVRLWSAKGDEEAAFERLGLGGGPATKMPEHTFHVAVENRTSTKLDYFVRTSLRQKVTLLPDGSAVVGTVVTIENTAPKGEGPSYQLGPDPLRKVPGEYEAWVLFWAPAGSIMGLGTPESGLNLQSQVIPIEPGGSTHVSFTTRVPNAVQNGRLAIRLVPQPRIENTPFEITIDVPGWKAKGPTTVRGELDRTRVVTWGITRAPTPRKG